MKAFLRGICIGLGIGLILAAAFIIYYLSARETTGQPKEPKEPSVVQTTPEESEELKSPPDPGLLEEQPTEEEEKEPEPRDVILAFAGDVQFSDHYLNVYDKDGIAGIADEAMLAHMRDADVFMLNEEFAFSLRGEPMADKQYTFRTDPKYVQIFKELGADAVTVANNHALDYGQDAFTDTLETLKNARIDCVGGGYHIAEASAPAVYEIEGKTFAIFAATRVSPSYSWYATDSTPGMFQTYDPAKLNAAIADASQQYDHVIVFVHWGIERNERPEDYQRSLAEGYVQAGADLIVGCHPHVLQGFEYIDGVPVAYSLGNYLFGSRDGDTLLLNAVFPADGSLTVRLVPCRRVNGVLTEIKDPSGLYRHLTELSYDAEVSEDGTLIP